MKNLKLSVILNIMPSKNSIKVYASQSFYHIYNRGVEKRKIFKDEQDYAVFLSYLKTYLSPKNTEELQNQLSNPEIPWNVKSKIIKLLRLNNFADEIKLHCYCLMPNHFHLLVYQHKPDTIDRFMNSLSTKYVVYFNRKNDRVGPLYQGVYKAVLVETDEQLVHLSAYIHRNPMGLSLQGEALKRTTSQPSSFLEYVGKRNTEWIETKTILSYFSKKNLRLNYENFILRYDSPGAQISSLVIE